MCYTARQYDSRAKKLMELESLKRDIQKQIEAIEADIKADMGATQEVLTGRYRITWQVIVSNRFDPKAFQEDHGKLYDRYKRPTETRRFTVKEV